MKDFTKQAKGEAEASLASALGERLIRRRTEPLGLIDVRYAEEKYFRIVRWLARNSALLDQLKRRYGVEEPPANAEHPFAIQRLPGQQVDVFSTTIQSLSTASELRAVASEAPQDPPWEGRRPSSLAQIIAERSRDSVSEHGASPEREFRISRRPPPMLRESDAAQRSSPGGGSVSASGQPGDATAEADSSAQHRPADFPSRSGVDTTAERAAVTKDTSAQENLPGVPVASEQAGTASSIVQRELFGSSSAQQPGTPLRNERGDTASPFVQRSEASSSSGQEPPASAPIRNEQAGTPSSIVQREVFGSSSVREPLAGTPIRNEQAVTPSSIVQREVFGSSSVHEQPASMPVSHARVDTASSVVERKGVINTQEQPANVKGQVIKASPLLQRELVRDTSAQEQPANMRGQVIKVSPLLQRELVRDTSAQEPHANLQPEPETRNRKPETLNLEPRAVLRTAVPDEQAGSDSSIERRADREIGDALPESPLPLIRPLDVPTRVGVFLPPQTAEAARAPESRDVITQEDVQNSNTSRLVSGAAAASEIRGDSFKQQRPHIVWRNPQAGSGAGDSTAQESRSGSGSSREAQAGAADFFPSTQQSGQDGLAARIHNPNQEIQLEHISPRLIRSISERVIRAITLDLKFERERRGVGKWR